MNLTVYEMVHSPYCIPITQALTALGIAFERVEVPNWDRSEVIRQTEGAYYQVPLLVHNGRPIYESSADSLDVARYVDTQFAGGRLFPESYAALQAIVVPFIENELEGLAFKLCDIHYVLAIEDVVARTTVIRHKERRFGRGCLDRWRAESDHVKQALDDWLGKFDQTLSHRPFLFGEAPVYADFALEGIIGNYTYRQYNALNPAHASLIAWRERLREFRFSEETPR